jgi:hypothetical protein
MAVELTFVFIVAATIATGLLAGASLDQSIKKLPAREKIGVAAYSQYSCATRQSPPPGSPQRFLRAMGRPG